MCPFVVPATQPASTSLVIKIACVLVALSSLWRYGVSPGLMALASIAASMVLVFAYRRHTVKRQLALIVASNGSCVAVEHGRTHDTQMVFALCSTNQMLLRARVTIDGHSFRQEWQLKRTDNETSWRLRCQWVQWVSSQGETKKPH